MTSLPSIRRTTSNDAFAIANLLFLLLFCFVINAKAEGDVISVVSITPTNTSANDTKPPCRAGFHGAFSRQAYAFSLGKLTGQPITPTQLALCPGLTFKCSGTLAAWRMSLVRQATVNKTFLGVWRRQSPVSAQYILVGSTPIRDPADENAAFVFPGVLYLQLPKRERFFVRKGDFLGVHYAEDLPQPTVAYLASADAFAAGLNTVGCIVVANKPKSSVLREIAWTKSVTVLDGDAIEEQRSYALTADLELPQIGERCDVDGDCPRNARCLTLSCTKQFCLCKQGYLPSRDGKTCRMMLSTEDYCSPKATACTGELDIPPSAMCSQKTSHCECSPGYGSRPPFSNKCRPIYLPPVNGKLTTTLTYGLLGDVCSADPDAWQQGKSPCWTSPGLECSSNGRCACRSGYRPKSQSEWEVYPNSLDECVVSTETAVGCFTTKLTARPDPTTTPRTTPTTKLPCYSTYTCLLLSLKNQPQTTKEQRQLSVKTTMPITTVTTTKPSGPLRRRIGEQCNSDIECPENGRCYPFTCDMFICTCKLAFTPNENYTKCYKEIDLGSQCHPKNISLGVCRGSLLLAGAVAQCTFVNGHRLCQCVSPYTPAYDPQFYDMPGYCRMAMPANNDKNFRAYGRIGDGCNENRPCYPPTMTVCLNGRCSCAKGYREKVPLEYGYLPDRTAPCVALDIGCSKFLSKISTTTRKLGNATYNLNGGSTTSQPTTGVPSTEPPTTPTRPPRQTAASSTSDGSSTASPATATTASTAGRVSTKIPVTMPPEQLVTGSSLRGGTATNSAATAPAAVSATPTTPPTQPQRSSPPPQPPPTITRPPPAPPQTVSTSPGPPTASTSTKPYPKPATVSTFTYSSSGIWSVFLPIIIVIGVLAIIVGIIIYCLVFRPKGPWSSDKGEFEPAVAASGRMSSEGSGKPPAIVTQTATMVRHHHNNRYASSHRHHRNERPFAIAESYVQQPPPPSYEY